MPLEGSDAVREEGAATPQVRPLPADPRGEFFDWAELANTTGTQAKIGGRIAYILISVLAVIVLGTFAYISWLSFKFAELSAQTLITLIQTVGFTLLTPLVGLIGAVTGFFYGGQTAVQGASQGAQAIRAATEAATEAATQLATQAATQALPGTAPETNVTFGGETFEPQEFADVLVGEVIPDLRQRVDQTSEVTWEDVSEERDVEAEALVEATRVLIPPPRAVARPGVTYGLLMGMVAVRAASLAGEFNSPSDRYTAAREWVCDNFYELIFWNCHNR